MTRALSSFPATLFPCDVRHRPNEATALTDMRKSDYDDERPEPFTICPAAARWKAANERGYFSRSSHPRRDERQPTA